MPKILTFGEIIWDIYPDKKLIGGAGLNFAAHCAKCGTKSYMISAVGNDKLGFDAITYAEDFGVTSELINRCDKPTGQCLVTLNDKGIPSYNVLRDVAYDNIVLHDKALSLINQISFDAVYFGTLIQRAAVSREALHRLIKECSFSEKVCDVNLREGCYDADSVKFCLENATILKISDEEEPALRHFGYYSPTDNLPESIAFAISEKFPNIRYIIITLGSKGAFVYCTNENRHFSMSPSPVKVASTVGAGDSFIAAWTTSILSGLSPEIATERAIKLSGFVVSRLDAIPNYHFKDNIIQEL